MANPLISILILTVITLSQFPNQGSCVQKTVFAHMANTPNAVRWGLNQGANAVEMDLRFDSNSLASYFQHSVGLEACDCTCVCPIGSNCGSESMCRYLWDSTGSHCKSTSTVQDMTMALGGADVRGRLAVIYIDSKLDSSIRDLTTAGKSVVQILNTNVFARGYQGQVIINGANTIYSDYLRGAQTAAKASPYASKYFYTFDFEGTDYNKVWNELIRLGTNQIVYSTGISICSSKTFYDAITGSVGKNGYAGIGIWTLDAASSMNTYLDLGVTSIMTNKPSVAVGAIGGGTNLASPGNALVTKTVPAPVIDPNTPCDCNYHSGGCSISKSAPPNRACKCVYKGAWTCGGQTVDCPSGQWNNPLCKNPDSTKASCLLGGGDCDGY